MTTEAAYWCGVVAGACGGFLLGFIVGVVGR